MTILKHYFNNLIKLFILTFFLGCAYSNSNRQVKNIIKVRNPYIDKVYDLEDTIYHLKEYHKNGYLNSERVYIYQKYDNVRIDTIIKNYKYSLNGQIVQENIYSQRTININDRTIHKKDTSFRYYKYEDDKLIMSKDSSKYLSSTSKFYFYNSEGIKIRETVITNSSGDSIVGLFDDQGYETRIFILKPKRFILLILKKVLT